MAEIPEARVFELDSVRLELDESEHPWVAENRAAIDAHWAREEIERPWLFNGTVMLHRGLLIEDRVIRGVSHRAPYAALLHLVATKPRADVAHLFGSAIVLSCDGAMLLIRMARNTANSGKVYAPAGSLDPSDISDGRIDVEGSIRREAREETGLDLSRVSTETSLVCWRQGSLVAIFRRFHMDETASVLSRRIADHIRTGAEEEIEDVVVVRKPADAGPTAPAYMKALMAHHFGSGSGG